MDFTLNKIDKILRKIELENLIENKDDTYSEYLWSKMRVEYIVRLMYAITVDMVIKSKPEKANTALYDVRTGTLGTYVFSAENGLISGLPIEKQEQYKEYWKCLKCLKDHRNKDAHPATSKEKLEVFIKNNWECIKQLEDITFKRYFSISKENENKYSYIILPKSMDNMESQDDIYCFCLDETGQEFPIKVRCQEVIRGNDKLNGQLYLRVESSDDTAFYRLTPFISLEYDMEEPSPKIFMGTVQFWEDEVMIDYRHIFAKHSDSDTSFGSCFLQSLVPKAKNADPNFNSLLTKKGKHIDINISHYPGYSDITNSSFRYCKEICPAVEQAVNFCINRTENYEIICGKGGLGKTALIFYLIHDVIIKGQTVFTRVIFLSAKKYFRYTDSYMEESNQNVKISPDIDNYQDFLNRLAIYFIGNDAVTKTVDEDELLGRINGKETSIPRTFLVVDDLDTFTWDDQCKVVEFLKKVNRKKISALITTRNERTNGYQIPLTSLDEKHSLLFLRWCIDQEKYGTGKHLVKDEDAHTLFQFTEGCPLEIKLWSNLMTRGLNVPQKFDKYWTKKQKTMYLYQTTLNQLSDEEKQIFCIVCGFRDSVIHENSDIGFPVRLIEYLFPYRSREELLVAIENLEDVNLLSLKGNKVWLEDIDYQELIKNSEIANLPTEFVSFLEDVKSAPTAWGENLYLERLLKYLASRLPLENSEYEHSILRKIYEDNKNLSQIELEIVIELLRRYDKDISIKEVPVKKTNINSVNECLQKLNSDISNVIRSIDMHTGSDKDISIQVTEIYSTMGKLISEVNKNEDKNLLIQMSQKFIENQLTEYLK